MGSFFQYTLEQKVHGSVKEEPKKKAPLCVVPSEPPATEVKATVAGDRIVRNMVRSFDDIRNRRILAARNDYVPPEQGGDPFATP